jgi:hypothetical protein
MPASQHPMDLLVSLSRRHLWFALILIVLLGINGLIVVGFPQSTAAAVAHKLAFGFTIFILLGVGYLRKGAKGISTNPSDPAMKAVIDDELRRTALSLSFRNGFFAMLLVQVPLALILTAAPAANPIALMVGVSQLAGAVVVLGGILYYDR